MNDEFTTAAGIVESLLKFSEEHARTVVLKVRVAVNAFTCLDPEQLWFCYRAITQDTVLAGSLLEIERRSAAIRCSECGYEGPPRCWQSFLIPIPTLQCPQCGDETESVELPECEIKSIQVRQLEGASS